MNSRPLPCEGNALPAELHPQNAGIAPTEGTLDKAGHNVKLIMGPRAKKNCFKRQGKDMPRQRIGAGAGKSADKVGNADMKCLRGAYHFAGEAVPAGFVALVGAAAAKAAGSFGTGFFIGKEF